MSHTMEVDGVVEIFAEDIASPEPFFENSADTSDTMSPISEDTNEVLNGNELPSLNEENREPMVDPTDGSRHSSDLDIFNCSTRENSVTFLGSQASSTMSFFDDEVAASPTPSTIAAGFQIEENLNATFLSSLNEDIRTRNSLSQEVDFNNFPSSQSSCISNIDEKQNVLLLAHVGQNTQDALDDLAVLDSEQIQSNNSVIDEDRTPTQNESEEHELSNTCSLGTMDTTQSQTDEGGIGAFSSSQSSDTSNIEEHQNVLLLPCEVVQQNKSSDLLNDLTVSDSEEEEQDSTGSTSLQSDQHANSSVGFNPLTQKGNVSNNVKEQLSRKKCSVDESRALREDSSGISSNERMIENCHQFSLPEDRDSSYNTVLAKNRTLTQNKSEEHDFSIDASLETLDTQGEADESSISNFPSSQNSNISNIDRKQNVLLLCHVGQDTNLSTLLEEMRVSDSEQEEQELSENTRLHLDQYANSAIVVNRLIQNLSVYDNETMAAYNQTVSNVRGQGSITCAIDGSKTSFEDRQGSGISKNERMTENCQHFSHPDEQEKSSKCFLDPERNLTQHEWEKPIITHADSEILPSSAEDTDQWSQRLSDEEWGLKLQANIESDRSSLEDSGIISDQSFDLSDLDNKKHVTLLPHATRPRNYIEQLKEDLKMTDSDSDEIVLSENESLPVDVETRRPFVSNQLKIYKNRQSTGRHHVMATSPAPVMRNVGRSSNDNKRIIEAYPDFPKTNPEVTPFKTLPKSEAVTAKGNVFTNVVTGEEKNQKPRRKILTKRRSISSFGVNNYIKSQKEKLDRCLNNYYQNMQDIFSTINNLNNVVKAATRYRENSTKKRKSSSDGASPPKKRKTVKTAKENAWVVDDIAIKLI